MGKTKDELFVIRLYEACKRAGDLEGRFDKYEIGKQAGINPKAVDAITKLLVQANFIRKSGELDVYLTPHGEKLALRLLGEDS